MKNEFFYHKNVESGFLTKRALVILQKLSRAKDTERDYFVPSLRLSDLRKSVLLATFKNCAPIVPQKIVLPKILKLENIVALPFEDLR